MLVEYRLRHNLDVGTQNRYGKKYKGHYDTWLVQHIHLLSSELGLLPSQQRVKLIAVEINATKFSRSKEIFGICLPAYEMERLNMQQSKIKVRCPIFIARLFLEEF